MSDTLFADVSEYQTYVNDAYPYHFISIRSNDGTYRDRKFSKNYAWCKKAADSGHIAGFLVYCVYRPNWRDVLANLKAQIGPNPHPKLAVMIDVESWGGQITGNQSAGINALREAIIKWLGGNRSRVIGYGNLGDLNGLWRTKGDAKVVVASYGSNPSYPNKIAHQYADNGACAPFGRCDMNSADGYAPAALASALGLVKTVVKPPVVTPPKPVVTPPAVKNRTYKVVANDTITKIASQYGVTPDQLVKLNRFLHVGQTVYIDQWAPVAKPAPAPAPAKPAVPTTYKVVSGDSLSGIASKLNAKYKLGLTWQKLAQLNHISNANQIKVGQTLKLR